MLICMYTSIRSSSVSAADCAPWTFVVDASFTSKPIHPCDMPPPARPQVEAGYDDPDKSNLFFKLHQLQTGSWGASSIGRITQVGPAEKSSRTTRMFL